MAANFHNQMNRISNFWTLMLMKLAMGIMSQFDDQFCFLLLKDVSVPERYLLKEIFRSGFFASILLGGIAKSVSSTDRKVTKLPSFFFKSHFFVIWEIP